MTDKVTDLECIAEVYPKDLGYVVGELVEAVNSLIDRLDRLEKDVSDIFERFRLDEERERRKA